MATTVGYGPRFLHSTGQLHKGDAGMGLFIQITDEIVSDVMIPERAGEEGSTITFGVLKMAQALGDEKALVEAGRKVIRFHFECDPVTGLNQLTDAIS
jgi:glucose-6-phosphate isomerase/transaldolase/glucose-6-phosphate isomerase